MQRRRSIAKTVTVAAIAFSVFDVTLAAQALVLKCPYHRNTFNGEVDFGGQGIHTGGSPETDAEVTWTFSSVNGAIVRQARIRGRLFLDKLGSGCVRMKIDFLDEGDETLQEPILKQFCGLGGNANSDGNKQDVDEISAAHAQLAQVRLTFATGGVGWQNVPAQMTDVAIKLMKVPATNITFWDRVNNGKTDFGGKPHTFGGPSSDAKIRLWLKPNGTVFGSVEGTLFWDDLYVNGTARIAINFLTKDETLLHSRANLLNAFHGNANDAERQAAVSREFTAQGLFMIRFRVGERLSNGSLVNNVVRPYSFHCPAQQ